MLDILLVVFSMIAVFAMFFLCYITHTLSKRLKDNDELISNYIDEIDGLRKRNQELGKNLLESKEAHKSCCDFIESLEEDGTISTTAVEDLNQ